MRDPRFDWESVRRFERRKSDQADAYLETIDRSPLEERTRAWWEAEAALSAHADVTQWRTEAAARAAACWQNLPTSLGPVLPILGEALASATTDKAEVLAMQRLVGRCIGEATARVSPDAQLFDQAVRFLEWSWPALDSFLAIFPEQVAVGEKQGWAAQLGVLPLDLGSLLERPIGRPQFPSDGLAVEDRRRRDRGLVAYLWDRRSADVGLRSRWVSRGRAILAMDAAAFARLGEALPLGELRQELVRFVRLNEDRESIRAVLGAAGPIFKAGSWTGNVMAIHGLEEAVRYAEDLHATVSDAATNLYDAQVKSEATAALRQLETTELSDWFSEVFDSLAPRPDFRELVLTMSARLVKRDTNRSRGRQRWSCGETFIETAASHMSTAATAAEIRTLAFASMLPSSKPPAEAVYTVTSAILGADPAGTWNWYQELLVRGESTLVGQVSGGAPQAVYVALAGVLLQLTDPIQAWRVAWQQLFVPDRERARFDWLDTNALLPSFHLVLVGFQLLNRRDRVKRVSDDAAKLFWRELRKAVLLLTQGARHPLRSLHIVGSAAGFNLAALVFGAAWGLALDESWSWMRRSPARQVLVADALVQGGVPIDDVSRELSRLGCDLAAVVGESSRKPQAHDAIAMAAKRLGSLLR